MGSVDKVRKTSVLLIENDPGDEKALAGIISRNYDIVPCKSQPDEVFSMLRDDSLNIFAAVVDIKDALPILTKIRKFSYLEKFPVLVIIDPESEIDDELMRLDVVDFIKRPFNGPRVLNRLKTAIRLYRADLTIDELERDELTGLYTRPAFLYRAEVMRSEHPDRKFCIIGFDFDNFKSSNTMYGQEKCDEFLAYTGRKLKANMPKGIAGRFGGDQYVLFFDYRGELDIEQIKHISDSVLESAPIPHQIVKMGIYAPIDHSLQIVVCCDRAFFAIREIKGIYGKDVAFFEDRIHQQILNEQRITETMESALEGGQFTVYYQPKHETISRKIAGAEALCRWNHPEYGLMPPKLFIPIFEKNGFIMKLDMFVLEQVCKDINRWNEGNVPVVPVSVNISRRDFMEQGCLEHLIGIIDSYHIPHNLLHLEVTESVYSENTDIIARQVKKAREMGFMIEMDDFGAGYSSLGLLSSFSLDVLKLDISFVRNIKANEIVIENIIKMAHRMGLLTVAEGADNDEQFKLLKSFGCDFIQGFYFSEPLPFGEYESYLLRNSVMTEREAVISRRNSKEVSLLSETILMAANEVADGLPGGFFTYHADGDLELISFNTELINMYACKTAEELREYTGNSFRGLVYKDDFESVQASIEEQITEDNDLDYVEYRILAKDGTIKPVRDFGRFVKTQKYGNIFYVFIYDITEEEQRKAVTEEALRKKQELQKSAELAENANRAKNIFMSTVVKDVMQPIKCLIECTDTMSENLNDAAVLKENLEKVRRNEEYLMNFINNLAELSDLENGEIELSELATDITCATEKIYALVEERAKAKGIKVEYWSELKNPYIYQDVQHTADVVYNIVSNAIKYTPSGGTIRFGIKQTPKNKDECNIEFVCEDTGIGISRDFLPFVFRSFAREENEINRNNPSAGLGLNIAKSLIQLMHGNIEITSEQGRGTTVRTIQPHRYAKREDIYDTSLVGNVRKKKINRTCGN
ncbi:MAG: EAL domain-containing protein [Spirochaetaceae bacterium]|nr:EAL domain-containing protein [Spirochaetaceae bacterium]